MSKTYTILIVSVGTLVVAACVTGFKFLADHTWNVANGDWTTIGNWMPAGAPSSGENALIPAGNCNLNADVGVGSVSVQSPGKLTLNSHSMTLDLGGGLENGGIVEVAGTSQLIGNITNSSGGVINVFGSATLRPSGGAILNNGSIRLNSTAGGTGTLEFTQSQTVNGTGSIQLLFPFNADLKTSGAAILTNGAGHTIRGRGFIIANLVNNGLIKADSGTADSLVLTGGPMTNNSEIFTASGTIKLQDVAITQGASGTISALAGDVRFAGVVAINGGALTSSGASTIQNQGTATLTDITNSGTLDLNGGTTVKLFGTSFTNNGLVRVNSNSSSTAFLEAAADLFFGGTGTVRLMFEFNSELNTATGKTLTNGASHSIRGRGLINAALVNNGSVTADIAGSALTLSGSAKINNATLSANPGILRLTNASISQGSGGTISATGGTVSLTGTNTILRGSLTANGGNVISNEGTTIFSDVLNSATINGGGGTTVKLAGTTFVNNGVVRLNTSASATAFLEAIDNVSMSGTGSVDLLFPENSEVKTAPGKTLTNSTDHRIKGRGIIRGQINNFGSILADFPGETLTFEPSGTGIVNTGTIQIGPGIATINNASLFTNAGAFNVANMTTINSGNFRQIAGTSNITSTLTVTGGNSFLLQGGALKGNGTIIGNVNNSAGEVQPGTSPGKLRMQGSYAQGTNGKLTIEIGGETQISEYDLLQVTGAASLEGTLRIEIINGFVPFAGSSFTVLTCASRTGAFDAVELMGTPGSAVLTYNANSVVVSFEQGAVVGTVNLGDWSASAAGQLVTFELWSGTNLVETISNVALDGDGHFSFATAQRGTFQITAKSSHWLRQRRIDSIVITNAGASGANFALTNGDADQDNEVNLVDFGIISSAFGLAVGDPGYNSMADLDGDGEVNLIDVAIISTNFGAAGDE